MKRILFSLLIVLVSTGIYAQKGEMSAGGSLGLELNDNTHLLIGGRFQYNVLDQLRLAPNINYALQSSDVSAFEFNADAHYLFPIKDTKFTIYPLAGLCLYNWHYDTNIGYGSDISDSGTEFGINLGCGTHYDFTDKVLFFGELKYTIVNNYDGLAIYAGIAYRF